MLQAITEELKLPLLQIARKAELGYMVGKPKEAAEYLYKIEQNANSAIRLIDSYLLGLELADSQQSLALEPVSLGSVLSEAAHQLSPSAKQNNVELELRITNRQPLVMGHAGALQTAILSLGSMLILAQPKSSKRSITLATFPKTDAMQIGIFGKQEAVSIKEWERSQDLYGRSRQPISALSPSNAAGIFVADTIFRAMSSGLNPSKFRKLYGFTATMQLSRQLQLI